VLIDIESIREASFVLIVNDAGTGMIILSQLIWKYIFIALGSAISRGYDQAVVRINKDNVTAV
jgi:hypothetical protein